MLQMYAFWISCDFETTGDSVIGRWLAWSVESHKQRIHSFSEQEKLSLT